MSESAHPAASVEFLSRLHDRELSAAEAREFDAHRASCAACREAVEDYERSLRAFRASPTAAPASDLSARILRKIREQSPSRRPFGVTFGIDVRWAGVLAAALLVVLIAPAFFHHDAKQLIPAQSPASPEALPAYLLEEKTTASAKAKEPGAKVAPAPPASAPANEAIAREKEIAKPEAAAERDLGAAQPRAEEKREGALADKSNAPVAAAPSAPVARTRRQAAAAPGGEAGNAAGLEEQRVSVHLVINAMDDYGEPPEVQETPTDDTLAALTGREFILLVETGGRVRDVTPSAAGGNLLRKDAQSRDELAGAKKEGSELLGLRFKPSDRPRRLLVRVE